MADVTFDLDAYLTRIGFDGERTPTRATLDAIAAAHTPGTAATRSAASRACTPPPTSSTTTAEFRYCPAREFVTPEDAVAPSTNVATTNATAITIASPDAT